MRWWVLDERASEAAWRTVADGLGFVRGVVVHDQMDVEVLRNCRFDPVEKAAEFRGATTGTEFAGDESGSDIERCEQQRHAIAFVVMAAPRDLAVAHR